MRRYSGHRTMAAVLKFLGVTVVGPVTGLMEILGERAVLGVRSNSSVIPFRALVQVTSFRAGSTHARSWVWSCGIHLTDCPCPPPP
jgi:hypothetical protein